MSSGFVSQTELDERRKKRQEEWEKVRKPEEPTEAPEEEYDHRCLYDRLKEQKTKRDEEYEESHKLKNMIKGLDDDEVGFLDLVDQKKIEQERKKIMEEAKELEEFRSAIATLKEKQFQERLREKRFETTRTSIKINSQASLLAGAVKRKSGDNSGQPPNKVAKDQSSSSNNIKEDKMEPTKEERRNEDSEYIGVLPGLGSYVESSESDNSRNSDNDDTETSDVYDLCGRRISAANCKEKS